MSDDLNIPAQASYRAPQREIMEPGTKRLVLIAAGLGAVLVGVVGVYSMTGRHGSGHLPVVEADSRPVRVKPENPGGLQVAGGNDEILSGDIPTESGKLAPPPEAPRPQALREHQRTAHLQDAPPSAPPAAPTPAPARPPVQAAPATNPAPSVASAPAATQPASADNKKAVAADTAPAASAGGHASQVQLAAGRSEEAIKAEWERLFKKMPDLLKGHRPVVSRAERDGRAFWRLRTGGFTDIAQASAFCERVRAKGAGCAIAAF